MLVEGEIESSSFSFRALYKLYTAIMRRPDQYSDIRKLVLALTGDSNLNSPDEEKTKAPESFLQDVQNIPEIKELLQDTAEGMALLIIDYSPLLRTIDEFIKAVRRIGILSSPISFLEENIEKHQKKNNPIFRSFYVAKNKLSAMTV